jgi:hypothetical protein
VLLAAPAGADEASAPLLFQSDGKALARVKERIAAGDKDLRDAQAAVVARADKHLELKPPTVVNKPKAPADGDKHDYVSLAPYWWPDPDKPDGLPYVRKDGETNPERGKYDQPLLVRMNGAVQDLSLAYYLTGDEKYAAHVAKLLRVWFLDKETYMKPNMNHAQFVPGAHDGRGAGLIEGRAFAQVVQSAQLLRGSMAWTTDDDKALKEWMREFIKWIGEHVGVDLWRYETKDGRGIRKTLDWLVPYATGEKKWTNKQIGKLSPAGMAPLLRRAAVAYQEPKYYELSAEVTDRNEGAITKLLYPPAK